MFNAPYWPVPPHLIPFPLPLPCELHYGPAIEIDGDGDEDDAVIDAYVDQIRGSVSNGCQTINDCTFHCA